MAQALKLKSDRIWTTTQERDAFIKCVRLACHTVSVFSRPELTSLLCFRCFTRPAYQIAENEAYMKTVEIRMGFYKVICLSVKFHNHSFSAQTSIIQSLQYFEHLSEPMAELLSILAKEFDHTQLTEEVLR